MSLKRAPLAEIDVTGLDNPLLAFKQAVNKAAPGTKIIYHRGNAIAGSVLARQVRNSYVAGLVELVQRRVRGDDKDSIFEYIAIRTGPKRPG